MSQLGILVPLFGISCGMVAIVGGAIVRPWLAYRERRIEVEARIGADAARRVAERTDRLEERLRVVERIVTDRGLDLADEIERLRDAPPPRRLTATEAAE